MNEDNKNNPFDFASEDTTSYTAGEEAPLQNSSADDFHFVQQDKSIHDVKFNTKPTTFLRDALRRFSKNHSSVTGGIILGVLFLLAIILPFTMTFDVENVHSYEQNLPPKIFNIGTGFMDGSRTYENQTIPYDNDGNWIGEYSEEALCEIKNIRQGYSDALTSDGQGGYIAVVRNADETNVDDDPENPKIGGYLYSYRYNYKLENTYTLSYTLGWRDELDIIQPKYDILFYDGTTFYPLTNYSLSYSTPGHKESSESTITPYETQTVNLTELILGCEPLMAAHPDATEISGYVGFCFLDDSEKQTAIYVKDAVFTTDSPLLSDQAQMEQRSFTDATECLNRPQRNNNQPNQAYWAGNANAGLFPADSISTRCDIVYDMYVARYGYRNDLPAVASSVFDNWISSGWITYTYGDPSSFAVTPAGEESGAVYVRKVYSENVDGGSLTLNCEILTWKWLGYDSMPIHVFGTDRDGRDILQYCFDGLRNSLLIGIAVAAVNIVIGIIWGSVSGYFGGRVDLIMERFVDILSGIPWIVLMTVLCLKLGQNAFVFGLALCLTGWIGTEAVTRSQFYRYRGREYVLASRTLGARSPRLIFRHILPNAIGTIVTSSVLMIPSVIFNEATISYLGLGFKNMSSLGVILSRYQGTLGQYPYQLAIPAILIALLMICFNLFGNGLRDAFNPSLKGAD